MSKTSMGRTLLQVTETTVLLNWLSDFPDNLVTLYSVEYDRMDFNGTASQPGTTKQIYLTDTEDKGMEIAGLDPSTLYAFRTKVRLIIRIVFRLYVSDVHKCWRHCFLQRLLCSD